MGRKIRVGLGRSSDIVPEDVGQIYRLHRDSIHDSNESHLSVNRL